MARLLQTLRSSVGGWVMKISKLSIFWWVTALTVLLSLLYFFRVLLTHPEALYLIAGAPAELTADMDAALLQASVQWKCTFFVTLTAMEALVWNCHFHGRADYEATRRKALPYIIAAGVLVVLLFLYLMWHKSFPLYFLPLSAAIAACLLIPILIFARRNG